MNKIIAHRGIHDARIKENTFLSIEAAINSKYTSGVEFDIRMTKDKQIVVIHDSMIDLLSDGQGLVKNMTFSELRQYNFGTPDHPQTISTLDEILSAFDTNKLFLIEIKAETFNKGFATLIYRTVREYANKNIKLQSFNLDMINYLYKLDKTLCLGLLIGENSPLEYLDPFTDFKSINYRMVDYKLLTDCLKSTNEFYFWTVNSTETVQKLRKISGDIFSRVNFITNNPKLIYDDLTPNER